MVDSITVNAPAKINIGLNVLPKRKDGYHNLQSIFSTISLHDTLNVSLTNKKNTCVVECEEIKLPLENTFTKAYKAFCVLTGIDCGVHVKVKKRIPTGGGLGGGSSDASSFIQSIDTLLGTKLDSSSLNLLASQVGSDVFFFTEALLSKSDLYVAFVEGRGERVQRIQPRADYSIVLVFPKVNVLTKDAYAWVDEAFAQGFRKNALCSLNDFVSEYSKPVKQWKFVNDFTIPVLEKNPEIKEVLSVLKDMGADFADMSGSGSTVFGIFETKCVALRAVDALSKKYRILLV